MILNYKLKQEKISLNKHSVLTGSYGILRFLTTVLFKIDSRTFDPFRLQEFH